jgi:RNA polymerase sigma-70 factor (ECF subfamily)
VDRAGLDEVFRRARRHDPQALNAVVEAYAPRIFGLLYQLTGSRDTAEDLLQETFLRMVRKIGDYEHRGKFEAWIFRIAANLARDQARRARRRGQPVTLDAATDGDEVGTAEPADRRQQEPGRRLMQGEASERLDACMRRLTDAEREIVLLRHFSGLSFREIADLLGVPLGTALARAHRALARLRAAFDSET